MWRSVGIAVVAFAAVMGCNGGSSDSSPSTPSSTGGGATAVKKKDLKITLIAKSNDNPVFQSAKAGAMAAAGDLGKANGVTITVDWQTPDKEDGQEQAKRIASAVNNGADCILISCSDAGKVTGAINDAVAKGVQVMTFDSDAPNSKRFAFYGADDADAGKEVMDELAGIAKSQPINVAILAGNENAPNLQKRSQAVIDEAKRFPNVKIVGTFHHIESTQDATAEVIKDDNAHPEINAWAMVGGWPLFGPGLSKLSPASYKIVAIDALPAELPYVDSGIAPVLLAQPVYDWGYKSVGIIVDKLILGKEVPTITKMDLVKVTKDSLGDWAHTLQKWGLPGIDPKYLALPVSKK